MIGGIYTLWLACDFPTCTTHAPFHGEDREEARAAADRAGWRTHWGSNGCTCPEHAGYSALDLIAIKAAGNAAAKHEAAVCAARRDLPSPVEGCTSNECAIRRMCTYPTACRRIA